MSAPILQAVHLYKQYTSRQGQLTAIEDVSFAVASGEFLCVVGPSGCGKSTLLRVLAGLLEVAHPVAILAVAAIVVGFWNVLGINKLSATLF